MSRRYSNWLAVLGRSIDSELGVTGARGVVTGGCLISETVIAAVHNIFCGGQRAGSDKPAKG
jgi:hypothetical protein